MWISSIWLRIERGVAGYFRGGDETSGFINSSKLSWAAEELLASQERLYSLKFVSRTQRFWSNLRYSPGFCVDGLTKVTINMGIVYNTSGIRNGHHPRTNQKYYHSIQKEGVLLNDAENCYDYIGSVTEEVWVRWKRIVAGQNQSTWRENCHCAILSTTNSTSTKRSV
jgi:hypothetical protein